MNIVVAGINIPEKKRRPRPGCSKLTTSLVNEALKFQTLLSQICGAKASLIFLTKNISVLGYKVVKYLSILIELTS